MNRFQTRRRPGKKFSTGHKLLWPCEMRLFTAPAPAPPPRHGGRGFRGLAGGFGAARRGLAGCYHKQIRPKLAFGTGVANVNDAVANGNQ
jgi:hypothetical protein